MKRTFFLLLFSAGYFGMDAQTMQSLDTIHPPADYENIYNRTLYHDTLVSSFVIFVKKEVKLHLHAEHAEHITILEGTGEMTLGDKVFPVRKGDLVFIPANTPHAVRVTSEIPMKVLSLQAPYFNGKDRVLIGK